MRRLELRIRLRDLGPGFAQPETELTEQPLALAHFQFHAEFAPQKRGQRRTIPHLRWQTKLSRAGAQSGGDFCQVGLTQAAWPAGTLSFRQASEAVRLETLHPVYHRAWRVAEHLGYAWARHALGHEQNAVQSMVVTRRVVAANFVLQCQDHVFLIGNRQCFHCPDGKPDQYYRQLLMTLCLARAIQRGLWRRFFR